MTQRKQLPKFSVTDFCWTACEEFWRWYDMFYVFPTLGKQKEPWFYNFDIWINVLWWITKMSVSVVSFFLNLGFGFDEVERTWENRWFVYCQAGLKTIGLEYMPEKDGATGRMGCGMVGGWDLFGFYRAPKARNPCGTDEGPSVPSLDEGVRKLQFPRWQPESGYHIFQHLLLQFFLPHHFKIREVLPKSESTSTFTPWQFLHQTQQDSLGFKH